tara:strand:+ start:638 stop:763 length:126 start_codon:yes stop_codon:yes gene_type:complete
LKTRYVVSSVVTRLLVVNNQPSSLNYDERVNPHSRSAPRLV